MKKIVKIRKAIRGLAMALALSTAVSGCSFNNGELDQKNDNRVAYEAEIDNTVEESHNHQEEVVEEKQENDDVTFENQENNDEEEVKEEETIDESQDVIVESSEKEVSNVQVNPTNMEIGDLVIPNLSMQFNNKEYTGVSIVMALRLAGYDYSFAYRARLAEYFGIENYRGTAEQNTLLLHYFRHPELFKTEEEKQEENNVNQEQSDVTTNENNQSSQDNGTHPSNDNEDHRDDNDDDEKDRDDDDKNHGKWELVSTRYEEIAGNDDNHIMIRVYRHSKNGKTKEERSVVPHNYSDDKCSNCGHSRKHSQEHTHKYGAEQIKYIDVNDDTHTKVVYKECVDDGFVFTVSSVTEAHSAVTAWTPDPNTNLETAECACGKVLTRPKQTQECEHKNLSDKQYEYKAIDDNSTEHTVIEYQICNDCHERVNEKTYTENHRAADTWEVDPTDSKFEILKCKDCGAIIDRREIKQECKHENTEWVYVDDSTEKEVCLGCHEDTGKTRGHGNLTKTQTTTVVTVEDGGHAFKIVVHCDTCNHDLADEKTDIQAHTLQEEKGTPTQNEDGTTHSIPVTEKCIVDGCTYEKALEAISVNCSNVNEDGTCSCGRDMSPIHEHHFVYDSPRELSENDKKTYCTIIDGHCTDADCNETNVQYISHENCTYERVNSGNERYDDIVLVCHGDYNCRVVIDTVKVTDAYTIGDTVFEPTKPAPGVVVPGEVTIPEEVELSSLESTQLDESAEETTIVEDSDAVVIEDTDSDTIVVSEDLDTTTLDTEDADRVHLLLMKKTLY